MQIDIFGSFLRKVKDEYRDSVREVESSKKGQHMPSEGIYDNAQWHYKIGFLKKVSKEQGATHIAFFPPMVFGEPACQSVLIGSDSRGFR